MREFFLRLAQLVDRAAHLVGAGHAVRTNGLLREKREERE